MQEYKIDINGVEHTFLFDDDEAKLRGLSPKRDEKSAPAPANKSRAAKNKRA